MNRLLRLPIIDAVRCPTCRKARASSERSVKPFCSARCKLIDLGRWLNGEYRIPDRPADPDEWAEAESEPGLKKRSRLH